VSIADSTLKDVEGKYIGKAAAKVIKEDLNILDVPLETLKIGIIGYGIIGNGVASAISDNFEQIAVYDESPIALLKAKSEGFEIHTKSTLLRTSDIIIGTTGNNSVSFDDLKMLKDGVILCSASSRAIELPIDQIKKKGALKRVSNYINEFTMPWSRRILIINNGFPINFRYNCLPISISDLMFCQLTYGIYKLLYQDMNQGIYGLTLAEEKFISNLWLESWDESVTD
jgi:adenosylhomocysteinase